ncbi:bile acid:sodium symporter family protein [Bermanella marisrubri]|uniref:Bile acid:sodium symporter n=1 Tax=Bermanella marisrubri TaxID=207949 RepID=Q1MZS8_9GAMM|nr:bile acid:sodium symporter family protein [Bermanella marisrubri]EAT11479.1 Bile acid:sodium symporter [Oceanobacter sp. RED65] [Bermanella marisrubri]QIZ85056.1 bile acid:sodium symporter family protein [Bermanella marisrubri]
MEAQFLTKVFLPVSLFIIMLGMGLSLRPIDFKLVIVKPKAVVLGLIAQMILLPMLAYLVVIGFGMTGGLAVGVMILALCPGGTTSNLYTYLAKGDIALSVTLTSVVSLIAPFTVPLLIVFFMELLMGQEEYIKLPVLKTILQLVVITIIPISLGMLIRRYKPELSQKLEKPVKLFSIVVLFVIIAAIVFKNRAHIGDYVAQAGLVTLILNVACMMMGYGIAKLAQLNEAQSKAIGIEVGFQNGTLAILIALTLLENDQMAIAATTYSLIMFATGGLFAWVLHRKTQVPVEVDA